MMRTPKVHTEVKSESTVTAFGGLVLVAALLRRLGVAEEIDEQVSVLKQHQPYTESDHILAQAMNLYVGGTCLEDMSELQHSEAARRILGAGRIPDPTTAGDFLRRFDPKANPNALEGLRHATDELQREVWEQKTNGLRKRTKKNKGKQKRNKRKQDLAVLDMDGKLKETYGRQKEGVDFSYKGKWSYHPLLISMAGTGDCLAICNRPGNLRSANGAAAVLDNTLSYVTPHFKDSLVRGDSDFDRIGIREVCDKHNAYFAFVGREFPNRPGIAQDIPEEQWKPLQTRAARMAEERRNQPGYRPRRKKPDLRRKRAREREYKELRQICQWVAEVPWTPPDSDKTYRLVIRRQLILESKGQIPLLVKYRYRYVVTNLPASEPATRVIDLTYERCDQENIIEQMGSSLVAWRMPVREFAGNSAWLEIARLAWNLAKWLAQLVLPAEVVRWEWKRFRRAYVYLAAEVIKRSRQIWVRFSGSHRFVDDLIAAHQRLEPG